jgi:hypothetical protein
MSQELKDYLDPSVKSILTSRGLKIIFNYYTGFDTEYQRLYSKFSKNELLSVQQSGNTGLYLKIPLRYGYKISYINPSTCKKSYIIEEDERMLNVQEFVETGINAVLEAYRLKIQGDY